MTPPQRVDKPFGAYGTQSLLLEEKVSPVRPLVTDVVENVAILPEAW